MAAHGDTRSGHPPDDAAGMSEEDTRRFVEQLRSAPAEQVLTEVFSTLFTAAEVKLGRRDARLFIDLGAAMLDHAGAHLSDELRSQVEKLLGRLRFGQVSAEGQVAEKGEPEPNDLSRVPVPPAPASRAETPSGGGPAESPASKLWVPGR